MKQINPLYIILLLVVILFVVLFKLMQTKSELHEAHNSFYKNKEMVHDIVDLRQSWDNQKGTKNTLTRILKSSQLRNAGVVQRVKRDRIELHGSAMDSKSASYLINRLLNEPFSIRSMKIRRLSKERARLDVEIRL
jgi:hypothetical protein